MFTMRKKLALLPAALMLHVGLTVAQEAWCEGTTYSSGAKVTYNGRIYLSGVADAYGLSGRELDTTRYADAVERCRCGLGHARARTHADARSNASRMQYGVVRGSGLRTGRDPRDL